jgi:hypothetical protein
MVYEKHASCVKRNGIQLSNRQHFVENKTEMMQHVLEMHSTSFLPKCIKGIYKGVSMCCGIYDRMSFEG